MIRLLSTEMQEAFTNGTLNPLLKAVKGDRDLILEFRNANEASIYCKGQCIDIARRDRAYTVQAHEKFLKLGPQTLASVGDTQAFVDKILPDIKQKMAVHRSTGMEIEFEQALIRANNLETGLNTDYFAVDRQVALDKGEQQRIDVLGVYWPDHRFGKELSLALIEVKFGLGGGIEKIAQQVEGYYHALTQNIAAVAEEMQGLLRQKIEMGLITGGEPNALAKLKTMDVSKDPKQVKIVLALVDVNPRSTLLERQGPKLAELEAEWQLASRIEIHHLGYGLWTSYAKYPSLERVASA